MSCILRSSPPETAAIVRHLRAVIPFGPAPSTIRHRWSAVSRRHSSSAELPHSTYTRVALVSCAHFDHVFVVARSGWLHRSPKADFNLVLNRTLFFIKSPWCPVWFLQIYTTRWAKKRGHRLVTIILSILNRFKIFFSLEDALVNLQLNGYQNSHRTVHMLLHYLVKH